MPTITIKFFAALRDITGRKEEKLEVGKEEPTILQVLDQLSDEYGASFKEYVFGSEGQRHPREQMSIMVNGQSIGNLSKFRTRVRDGDIIAILPPISGG